MSTTRVRLAAGAVALLALAPALAGCGGKGGPAAPAASPSSSPTVVPGEAQPTAAPTEGVWRRVADGPLSARSRATAVWTGSEVLVFGGHGRQCPVPNCEPEPQDVLADGAAYDPARDAWRPIAPAPVPMLAPETALVAGTLYVRTTTVSVDPDAVGEAAEGLTSTRWFAYAIGDDKWRELRADPGGGHPVAAAEVLFSHRRAGGAGGGPAYAAYDPEADTWTDIADDQLGAGLDRGALGDGGHLYSIAYDFATDDAKARVAAYDPGTKSWSRLPDPPIGALPTVIAGGRLIDPAGQYTAMYDPLTREWAVGRGHPAEVGRGNVASLPGYVVGPGVVLVSPNVLLDATAMTWLAVPEHEALGGGASGEVGDVAAAWAGDRLFVWGGRRGVGSEGAGDAGAGPTTSPSPAAPGLMSSGWTWQPVSEH